MRKILPLLMILAFAVSCTQKGGTGVGGSGMSGPGGGPEVPAVSPVPEADVPQDTPPMAGPTPTEECDEEKYDVNCPEPLNLTRKTLCARTEAALNPVVTGSQTLATTLKPLSYGPSVDVKIVSYAKKPEGDPSGSLAAPSLDLKILEEDLDPEKPGRQIGVETDGTVRFHLVAGEKTGYYEIHVTGDLDTADGNLTIEDCELGLDGSSNSVDTPVKPVLKY